MRGLIFITATIFPMLCIGQIEVPEGDFACQKMKKDLLTYCIDVDTYTTQWTAIQIKGIYIEEQTYIPSDKELFRDIPISLHSIWSQLEKQVKLWAMEFDSVYVVTGQIHIQRDSTETKQLAYYKAILKGCQGDGLGFVFAADEQPKQLKKHAVTIRQLETMTKMNFFSNLDPDLQDIFETNFSWQFWPLRE